MLVAGITVFFGYQLPELRIEDELEMWFSEEDPVLETYREFRDLFPTDEVNVVAYPVEDPFSSHSLSYLAALTRKCEQAPHVEEVISLANVEDIIGTEDLLEVRPLVRSSEPGGAWVASRVSINPFMRGTLVSSGGQSVGILVKVKRTREQQDSQVSKEFVRGLMDIIGRESAAGGKTFYIGGPTIFDAEVARMIEEDMERFMPLTLVLTAVLLILVFRSLTAILLPLVCVSVAGVWTLGLKGYCNNPLTPVSPTLFALIAVIGLANSIHLIHHYRLEVGRGESRERSLLLMFERAGWPCFLTSFTTAVGFGSLTISQLPIIRNLGIFAAFGILSAFFLSFTLIPIGIQWTRMSPRKPRDMLNRVIQVILRSIGRFDLRAPRAVLATGVGIVLVMSVGIFLIEVRGDMLQYMRKDSWLWKSSEYLDRELGGISNLEVVITGNPDDFKRPDLLERIDEFETFALTFPSVSSAYSVVDYLKLINRALGDDEPSQFRIPSTREGVAQALLLYELDGGKRLKEYVTPGYDRARVSLRTVDMSDRERTHLLAQVDQYLRGHFPEYEVKLTGITQLFEAVNRHIVQTQVRSLMIAFFIILGLMLVNFGFKGGLISILPNIFPIVFMFGLMGYAGFTLNVGTAIIAAIAIGLVVDDTIHYFSHFRYELGRCGSRREAATNAIEGVGSALCYASVALILGFGIFLLSESQVLVDFGILSVVGIVTALLGDLFLSPVLLLLFRVYENRFSGKKAEVEG